MPSKESVVLWERIRPRETTWKKEGKIQHYVKTKPIRVEKGFIGVEGEEVRDERGWRIRPNFTFPRVLRLQSSRNRLSARFWRWITKNIRQKQDKNLLQMKVWRQHHFGCDNFHTVFCDQPIEIDLMTVSKEWYYTTHLSGERCCKKISVGIKINYMLIYILTCVWHFHPTLIQT